MPGLNLLAILGPAIALALLSYFTNLPAMMPTHLGIFVIAILASLCTLLVSKYKPEPQTKRALAAASSSAGSPSASGNQLKKETGSVKWFNASKGFGFITRANGEEVFVHFRSIVGQRALRDGQRVEFAVTTGNKGPQAEDVVTIK